MNEESGIPMAWKGQESIQPILETLQHDGFVKFHLPESYHHALFVHMYPEASPGQVETVDVESGVDLLARMAQIESLEPIAGLIEPLQAMGYIVRITSPSPTVLIKLPSCDE